jgi:hypothetical protein
MSCRGCVLAAVIGVMMGCGGVGRGSALAVDFPREVTVYVAVSQRVAKNDTGNVAAMVDALEADLRADGRFVTIIAARLDEAPPVPRVEIQVRDSSAGNAELRGAGQLSGLLMPLTGVALVGAGNGSMEVDAYVVTRDNRSRLLGRYSSSGFGAISEESVAAGDRVGHSVASALEE